MSCEAYYPESELVDGDLCPIHTAAGRPVRRRRTTSSGSSATSSACSTGSPHDPDVIEPESQAQRGARLHPLRASTTSRSRRTSLDWGVPVPWAEGHVFYVWYDALDQLRHGGRLRHRRRALRARGGRPSTTSSARRSSASTACTGRRCCWPRGSTRRTAVHVARLAAARRREDEQDVHGPAKLTDIAPARLVDDFGVDGFRYYFLARHAVRPGRRLHLRAASSTATTPTSPTTSATSLSRVATVVGKKCGGVGPAPRADSPLAAVAARGRRRRPRRRGTASQPSVALEATWRLIRETNAYLEANEPWKLEPGPQVDGVLGDALEALRIVAILASPAIPATAQAIWERIGLPGSVARPARARRRRVGRGTPAALPVTKGPPLFPAHQDRRDDPAGSTRTATSLARRRPSSSPRPSPPA